MTLTHPSPLCPLHPLAVTSCCPLGGPQPLTQPLANIIQPPTAPQPITTPFRTQPNTWPTLPHPITAPQPISTPFRTQPNAYPTLPHPITAPHPYPIPLGTPLRTPLGWGALWEPLSAE